MESAVFPEAVGPTTSTQGADSSGVGSSALSAEQQALEAGRSALDAWGRFAMACEANGFVGTARDAYRLHLQVTSNRRAPGKLKFMAGSEAAMGAWVNDVPPEQAAAQLREVAL